MPSKKLKVQNLLSEMRERACNELGFCQSSVSKRLVYWVIEDATICLDVPMRLHGNNLI